MTPIKIAGSLVVPSTHPCALAALNGIGHQERRRGNQGTRQTGKRYLDVICAFDTESTTLRDMDPPQAFTYVWQLQVGPGLTIIGRTWPELFELFGYWQHYYMEKNDCLCIFVHNLSYDFQFMQGVYPFQPEEVFAIESRKVLKCTVSNKHFEFRCSYLHSNMSLDQYCKKMGCTVKKLTGQYDYDKIRYPWTPLDPETELPYCVHDVVALVEAVTREMENDGDNLYTFPLTSTGYVRRDAKKAMRWVSRNYLQDIQPDYDLYCLLREGFRGGNVHASRFRAGVVIREETDSKDESSAYPFCVSCCDYPISRFYHVGYADLDEVLDLINRRHKAVIMRVAITGLRLRDDFNPCPYLSRDKCRKLQGGYYDNGRVLEAHYLETTITDLDLKIILNQYDFDDICFFDVYMARYGKLNKKLVNTVLTYYALKTKLKNVEGQEVYYGKAKNKLNSIYGMMAQDPVKQTIDFIEGEYIEQNKFEGDILEEHNKKAFLAYQWGVWTTAWARTFLQEGIDAAGYNFVYCDTDSVKYIPDQEIEKSFKKINVKRKAMATSSGAYSVDPQGVTHYMGVYEEDGIYTEFKTLGAKKYVYKEKGDDRLHVTIAGVGKRAGAAELERAGGIEAFREGFVFYEAGGMESIYNDIQEPFTVTKEGKELLITSNIVLSPSMYTLGTTGDYARLLQVSRELFLKDFKKHGIM